MLRVGPYLALSARRRRHNRREAAAGAGGTAGASLRAYLAWTASCGCHVSPIQPNPAHPCADHSRAHPCYKPASPSFAISSRYVCCNIALPRKVHASYTAHRSAVWFMSRFWHGWAAGVQRAHGRVTGAPQDPIREDRDPRPSTTGVLWHTCTNARTVAQTSQRWRLMCNVQLEHARLGGLVDRLQD